MTPDTMQAVLDIATRFDEIHSALAAGDPCAPEQFEELCDAADLLRDRLCLENPGLIGMLFDPQPGARLH